MNIRRAIQITVIVCLAMPTSLWLLWRYGPEFTMTFSRSQLQAQLDARFPVRKCVLGACVALQHPQLVLAAGADRLELETAFVASLGTRQMSGTTRFSGRPHYEPGTGRIYLKDVQVLRFEMTGQAPDFNDVVARRGPAAAAAIMNNFPLYAVQSYPGYGELARLALKRVDIEDGKLRITLANPFWIWGR